MRTEPIVIGHRVARDRALGEVYRRRRVAAECHEEQAECGLQLRVVRRHAGQRGLTQPLIDPLRVLCTLGIEARRE